jgi:hypothetical protein
MSKKEMAEIFGRCSRLLNKVALETGDKFFSRLCAEESDELSFEFIFFLEEYSRTSVSRREELRSQNALGNSSKTRPGSYVAQCEVRLFFRIEKILSLLNILRYLNLVKQSTSLLLEKNLLLLKLAVLNVSGLTVQTVRKKNERAASELEETVSNSLPEPKSNQLRLGRLHYEVFGFIKSKGRTQNKEVFSQFGEVSRRTIKRKLSELVQVKAIKRVAEGRKVFYSVLLSSESELFTKSQT